MPAIAFFRRRPLSDHSQKQQKVLKKSFFSSLLALSDQPTVSSPWVSFMMRFELGLEEPDPDRAWKSALTIAVAYVVGGIIPLSAYLFLAEAHTALKVSVLVTIIALAVFGGIKGSFTGAPIFRSAIQTATIGGLAAAAAFGIARWIA